MTDLLRNVEKNFRRQVCNFVSVVAHRMQRNRLGSLILFSGGRSNLYAPGLRVHAW